MTKRILSMVGLAVLAGAAPPSGWQVERSDQEIRLSNPEPGTTRVSIRLSEGADEVVVTVDYDGDGDDEYGPWGNRGLSGAYRMSCTSRGFVTEYESVRLYDPEDRKQKRPVVSIDHYVDGNVRVILDGDRDGRADGDVTTSFVVRPPERSPFCVRAMPVRPGLPRPR